MSVWRARGYVPDSDDEEDEGLELEREIHSDGEHIALDAGSPELGLCALSQASIVENHGSPLLDRETDGMRGGDGHEEQDYELDSLQDQRQAQGGNEEQDYELDLEQHQGQDEEQPVDSRTTGRLSRITNYRQRYKDTSIGNTVDQNNTALSTSPTTNLEHSATNVGNFFPSSATTHLPRLSSIPNVHNDDFPPSSPPTVQPPPATNPATNVGNFFPSSAPTAAPSHCATSPLVSSKRSDLRRASVSSSDLSDVDLQILASSPRSFLDRPSSQQVRSSRPGVLSQPLQHSQELGSYRHGSGMSVAQLRTTSEEHLDRLAAPSRNFRTRKAIQLHPYLLEQEKYRQALKARGYRPVHVATSQPRPEDIDHSQELDINHFTPSQTQETTSAGSTASPDLQRPLLPRQRPALLRLEDSDDEDTFPDTRSESRIAEGVQNGFKRRKTIETPSNHRQSHHSTSSTSVARGKLRSLGIFSRAVSVTDVSPSPPRSTSPTNAEQTLTAAPLFRKPRGMTPPTAESSTPSSPPTKTSRLTRRVIDLSDSDQSDQSTQRSSSPDPEEEAKQLRRMQKRIKGVLPASWLKLDEKTRAKRPSHITEHEDEICKNVSPVKGVAQRISSGTANTHSMIRANITLSDDSDACNGSIQGLLPDRDSALQTRSLKQRHLGLCDDDAVEEYDEIDRMFSGTPQPRSKNARSKNAQVQKKQSRLTDGFVCQPGIAKELHRDPLGKPRPRGGKQRQLKPKSRARTRQIKPAELSILDVTDRSVRHEHAPPKFLRIAARQARKRPDKGRHSPTQKTIRLATHNDTLDAVQQLQAWNDGKLRPSAYIGDSVDGRDSLDQRSLSTSRTIRRALDRVNMNAGRRLVPETPKSDTGRRTGRAQMVPLGLNHIRPGQLETRTTRNARDRDFLTFAPPPSRLMEIFRKDRAEGAPSRFRLERFLQDRGDGDGNISDSPATVQVVDDTVMDGASSPVVDSGLNRRHRKRLAQRLDVELRTFRQPSEPIPGETPLEMVEHAPPTADVETLRGLGPFGTRYPTDFDVRPLAMGTHFCSDTFIGSGEFARSLELHSRDLDLPTGRMTIDIFGQSLSWGAWDESMSSALSAVSKTTNERLQSLSTIRGEGQSELLKAITSRMNHLLRSLIRYCTQHLHFLDPIDRLPCVQGFSRLLDDMYDVLQDGLMMPSIGNDTHHQPSEEFLDLNLYLVCLSAQMVSISQHPSVYPQAQSSLIERTVKFSRRAIALGLPRGLSPLRAFLEDHRQYVTREAGIKDDQMTIKCVVTVNHVLQSMSTTTTISDMLFSAQEGVVGSLCDIHILDQLWYDIFTLQPFLELDSRGTFRPGSRHQCSNDHWPLVKCLLQRLFQLYPASRQGRNPSFNEYVRACFSRAYRLISVWGWRRCESVLNTVYDFFASNGFSQLQNECSRGSPSFLEELDKKPVVDLETGDTAFHVFLKLLVVGLQSLQLVYPKTKIRGFAWRFIPNHGRTYRKDQEVTQSDLDALRNNHDLLCTLYWVLPEGSGPRLQMIQNLVDHTSSHREACRLSVHAWGIIAKYKLSTGESFKDLQYLAEWFRTMALTTISQYRLARLEAETQFTSEVAKGNNDITQDMVEMTIAANQRGIFATLMDLLQSLDRAVRVSVTWDISRSLVAHAGLTDVFKIFDPDQPRLFAAIVQALAIIQVLYRDKPRTQTPESQQESEDSQEYGDWSYLEEVAQDNTAAVSGPLAPKSTELGFLHEPLAGLLSSAFGSDKSPDEELLKILVKVWATIAMEHVKSKEHEWTNYLGNYSTNSWFQLRSTDQTRKYTSYFLSTVLDLDNSVLDELQSVFLGSWLVSLLERESMLKFQHMLTSSLLNTRPGLPLLHNLPFASSRTGRFETTLTELRERRESLIDCILSNMHASYSAASSSRSVSATGLKAQYEEMLKQAMAVMRRNFEELQQASPVSEGRARVQGLYVSFVQHVVSLMQQYTSDICRVDKFFVDSSVFPLPSHDPTYVVGRLKRYAFKLGETRARKELAVFMQTVSERAAVDDEQSYLVSQLREAMTGKLSHGLRAFLMMTIFPAYLEAIHTTTCGWISALPILKATALVLSDLIYDLDTGQDMGENVLSMTAVLQTIYQVAIRVAEHPLLLLQPEWLVVITLSFQVVGSSLTVADYIQRRFKQGHAVVHVIRQFVKLGDCFLQIMRGEEDVFSPDSSSMPAVVLVEHKETADFSRRSLREDMNRCWIKRDDAYLIVRGNSTRTLNVQTGSMDEEQAVTMHEIEEFLKAYEVVFQRKLIIEASAAFDEVFI